MVRAFLLWFPREDTGKVSQTDLELVRLNKCSGSRWWELPDTWPWREIVVHGIRAQWWAGTWVV